LIQLCAPKDSVKHFNSIRQEKYHLKLNELHNQFKPKNLVKQNTQNHNLGSARETAIDGQANINSQPDIQSQEFANGRPRTGSANNIVIGTFQSSV